MASVPRKTSSDCVGNWWAIIAVYMSQVGILKNTSSLQVTIRMLNLLKCILTLYSWQTCEWGTHFRAKFYTAYAADVLRMGITLRLLSLLLETRPITSIEDVVFFFIIFRHISRTPFRVRWMRPLVYLVCRRCLQCFSTSFYATVVAFGWTLPYYVYVLQCASKHSPLKLLRYPGNTIIHLVHTAQMMLQNVFVLSLEINVITCDMLRIKKILCKFNTHYLLNVHQHSTMMLLLYVTT